jgi:hypothetical protein
MLVRVQDGVHWRVRHTASEQKSDDLRASHWIRLSRLAWLVIAAGAVAGGLAIEASHHDQLVEFAAPVGNVAAFHVLSASDLRPLWRPASQVPPTAIRDVTAIVGRVTLTSLAANQPITAAELGPAAVGRHGALVVVGVPATAAMALDGQLTPGQTVGAVVPRPGHGRPGYAQVLVLSVSRTGAGTRPYVVLIAIPARTPRWEIADLGAGSVTLVSKARS